uniref:Uncharacterized protein n=1 Tax=Gasterosteus aculeatus TaxID=69293 RepID=G3N9X8_GASAC
MKRLKNLIMLTIDLTKIPSQRRSLPLLTRGRFVRRPQAFLAAFVVVWPDCRRVQSSEDPSIAARSLHLNICFKGCDRRREHDLLHLISNKTNIKKGKTKTKCL